MVLDVFLFAIFLDSQKNKTEETTIKIIAASQIVYYMRTRTKNRKTNTSSDLHLDKSFWHSCRHTSAGSAYIYSCYTYIYMIYVYIYMYICMYIYMYVYIYTYIYVWHFILQCLWHALWHSIDILFGILSSMYSDILSGIYSDSFWHILWHLFWHSLFGNSMTIFLAGYLEPAIGLSVQAVELAMRLRSVWLLWSSI